jgi:hypothetical protein
MRMQGAGRIACSTCVGSIGDKRICCVTGLGAVAEITCNVQLKFIIRRMQAVCSTVSYSKSHDASLVSYVLTVAADQREK